MVTKESPKHVLLNRHRLKQIIPYIVILLLAAGAAWQSQEYQQTVVTPPNSSGIYSWQITHDPPPETGTADGISNGLCGTSTVNDPIIPESTAQGWPLPYIYNDPTNVAMCEETGPLIIFVIATYLFDVLLYALPLVILYKLFRIWRSRRYGG